MALGASDVVLPIVPQYHVFCWGYPFAALTLGLRFCLYSEWADPGTILQFCIDRVIAHCKKVYARFQLPDDVLLWDALPETSTRKINKKGIRETLKKEGYILPSLKNKSKL